jgi:hypothetical protein
VQSKISVGASNGWKVPVRYSQEAWCFKNWVLCWMGGMTGEVGDANVDKNIGVSFEESNDGNVTFLMSVVG